MLLLVLVALLMLGSKTVLAEKPQENNTYIILAPKGFRPGMAFSLKVTILKSASPVTVVAAIQSSRQTIVENTGTFTEGNTGDLQLMVPYDKAVLRQSYFLAVNGSGGLLFSQKSYISFNQKGFSMNIQTDKGIYKPGQTVRMRIFALLPNLMPYMGKMVVDILDPHDNKMSHWEDLKDPSGVIKKDFPLSSQPVLGIWKVQVLAKTQKYERPFEVKEYVLPKFKVSVTLPPFVEKKNVDIKGSVTAKYTYGKGVKGSADVYISFHRRSRYTPNPIHLEKTIQVQGTGSFTFTMKEVKSLFKQAYSWASEDYLFNGWVQLYVNTTVHDDLTSKKASGQDDTKFYYSDVKLEFPSFNPNTFKPGLMFQAALKVSQPDGTPIHPDRMKDLKIIVAKKYMWSGNESVDAYTPPSDGIIVINMNVPSNALIVHLRAWYNVDDKHKEQATFTANKAESPSNSYIQLSTTTPSVKAGHKIHCSVRSSFPMSSFVYLVMGRGRIREMATHIASGGSTKFHLTASSIMAPSAQVLVYTIRQSGEVIVDSLTITIENPFENKVSLAFGRNSSRPGDQVNLIAKATPGSSVAFRVVDQSVLLMKKDNDVTCNMVMSDIQGYSNSYGGYPWWEWNWFRRDRRRRRMIMPFPVSGVDAKSVFKNSGLIVLSNCLVYRKQQWRTYPVMYAESAPKRGKSGPEIAAYDRRGGNRPLAAVTKVRSLFPETWIWSDTEASATGEAEISTSVPDTITSWVASAFAISPITGFGVACQRAKLRVFQPFFITLDLPYSVTRGEEVAIKALVFNYLEEPQEVTITLKESDDWKVINELTVRGKMDEEEPKDIKVVVTVPANEGKAVAFPVIPKTLGNIPIVVQAQSVVAADAVRRNLIVEPEGVPQEYSYSLFIDLNSTTTFDRSLELALPKSAVKGSAHGKVSVLGDILGSSFSNLDNLIRMPYGCGEQNMVNFAPNIFILKYLTAVKQMTTAIKNKAETYMIKGYQREQTYRHSDGSYSAFGERDGVGSMWLTAFVVKSFAQARKYIYVDPKSLALSAKWMARKQNVDGSFPVVGAIHSASLKGGLKGAVPLTAFVVISLAEAQSKDEDVDLAMKEAVRYLERKLQDVINKKDVYSLAISTYAFSLAKSGSETKARQALLKLAISEDGTMHWSDSKKKRKPSSVFRPYYRPRSADIEITAYALLAITSIKDLHAGLPVVRWLSQQRNSLGGYSSTQDTVLGVQAMAEFAALIYSPNMDFTVKLTNSVDKAFSKTFTVNSKNAMVLQQVDIPKVEGMLEVHATGHGIGMLQVGITYYVNKVPGKSNFEFIVEFEKEGSYEIETKACAKWLGDGERSNMAVMELGVTSGFAADTNSISKLLADKSLSLKRVDSQDRKVVLYFDAIFAKKMTCVKLRYGRTHATGKSQPVPAVVYDYYSPENRATALYVSKRNDSSVCRVCPLCVRCNHLIGPTEGRQRSSSPFLRGHCVVVLVFIALVLLALK